MISPLASSDRLSPNRVEKQQQIVEAAKSVLARQGLANCTARAVADASPLTKSAIHYYFTDMDEVIDRAMADHIAEFLRRVRTAAGGRDAPPDRVWAAVNEFLNIFRETPGSLLLWCEYWVDSVRRGRLGTVHAMLRDLTEIFAALLGAARVADADRRAHALTSFLIGTVTQRAVHWRSVDEIRSEAMALVGLGA